MAEAREIKQKNREGKIKKIGDPLVGVDSGYRLGIDAGDRMGIDSRYCVRVYPRYCMWIDPRDCVRIDSWDRQVGVGTYSGNREHGGYREDGHSSEQNDESLVHQSTPKFCGLVCLERY